MREKEKELERVEEQGYALVQNKTDEACAIVMETLQGVNHTWANLDHLVNFLVLFIIDFKVIWSVPCCYGILRSTDWTAEDQFEVSPGSVEFIQAGLRRNQWLPHGGKVLCITVPSPHWLY